ncbi:hypothetical protein [Chryseobacterium arthrosphaerae]|uniref:Uncharacterized protein n=1 Tax=Chryseobacterium arthrosphaerae TaxID=651561 RepID=A0A1B8ZSR5_9FLAO|nr:hypothetical protein [Chryseobacterium arthrosphaerae]OCA74635.1 hypothetical protein BBI00_09960 [Chryseobacterium arthrosphaerae]
MINGLFNFFSDYDKLFYWLLLLTSWFLSADIVAVLFLNKSVEEIFTMSNISDILIVFIFHIIFILTSSIVYRFFAFISLFIPKVFIRENDFDYKKGYYSYSEILNKAVQTNNQTMYNFYKDCKNGASNRENRKYLCFTTILLFILALVLEDSYLRLAYENYKNGSLLKTIIISIIVLFDLLGLFVIFHEEHDLEYTSIKKEEITNK